MISSHHGGARADGHDLRVPETGCVVEQVSARTLQGGAPTTWTSPCRMPRFTALLEKELRHERYLLLDGTVRIFDPAAGIEAYSGLAARAGMDV
ncbi:MAG: hypothetical protein ACLT98_07105 [Eggerthellaceae bacterium]